ncbi:hypothetical protein ILUMI_04755 [Ignelater luminosus]|uniref:Probable ATP-dependent RNA helicase spindle-E n=1 Tax=Ignelater luminosus TaxID=2038154 RepID=A0A8K0DDP3_IGNLU|nr:hypothetical protein ILUMI_04755 [Ignelater luminosus]
MTVEPEDEDQYEEFIRCQNADKTIHYAEAYIKEEEERYSQMCRMQEEPETALSMVDNASDLLSSIGRLEIDAIKEEQSRETFTKYNFDKHRTQTLIIDEFREQILDLINTNNTVIIDGPTGCGKTTQVPQFILDDCKTNGRPCRIVVTQPRRIAAISVARRVCEERNWSLGTVCGYQVGLETNLTGETLLQYVTTGILLQKLINQKNLHEYTHIVVDEVHERNQDMDFLLLIVRRFLNTNSMNTKVILMSATFNSEEFSEYFKSYSRNQFIAAPIISMNKRSKYNTQTFYVEQLSGIGRIPPYDMAEPKIESCLYDLFSVLIRAFSRLDPQDPLTNKRIIGNVLVFLPGILEIEEAHDRLIEYGNKIKREGKMEIEWHILPLHSSITTEEQRKVFQPPPLGKRKIILSTNIAESSITVPDIFYVVDFCLTKTMIVDQETQYQSLQLQWASHVNCIQRSGRVGRVADGRVYRLVTKRFYEQLPTSVQPEIVRAPLNQVVLNAKLLDLDQPPKAILALAMNPPELSKIDNTVLYLKEIGALSRKCKNRLSVSDGDITFLGKVMACLPLDVHLSKLIFLGHMFSCLNECVIMATGCSLNIFKTPFKERLKAYINRLQWADGSASDLIAYINIYQVWQKKKRSSRDVRVEQEWCRQNYVSQRSLKEWSVLVKEVQDRLERMHIKQTVGQGHIVLSSTELATAIMVVICGAFYPYYFKRTCDGASIDEREAVKTLGGRDPFHTVYFTGFDYQQPGKLYAKTIKKQLLDCGTQMEVTFDHSSKVYVEFSDTNQNNHVKVEGQQLKSTMPGNILVNVYRAIRLRQLGIPIRVPILEKEKAWALAEKKGIGKGNELPIVRKAEIVPEEFPVVHTPVIPALDVGSIHIYVCVGIHCGRFWAQNVDEETTKNLVTIIRLLNRSFKLEKVNPNNINEANLYAAIYKEDKRFYRCKIIQKTTDKNSGQFCQIQFIDYGNEDVVGIDELYYLPEHEYMSKPGQAMECVLSEIQPSAVLNPRALWTDRANQVFNQYTTNQSFYAKVYSVVQGVVHLELYKSDCSECIFSNSLNNWLIEEGYAELSEESYLSKENHLKRLELSENPDKVNAFMQAEELGPRGCRDVEPPPSHMCTSSIFLKGPFSPFEMHIFSVIASGANKQVIIDGNSVNAVLLDSSPQDTHERLIVAAHIGQNATGSSLSLRHTTLMPNIHGLPMLMSLLFCPIMETKPTENGSRFAAILCGLGTFEDGHRSLYPPHDICLILDTDLTDEDLNMINVLRYWMNVAVKTMECNYQEIGGHVGMEECQTQLKNTLFKLLRRQRTSVERVFIKNANIWGKCLFDSELLKPGESYAGVDIWPLHSTMRLNREAAVQTVMNEHLNELEEISLKMRTVNETECRFCNKMVYSTGEIRIHLNSKQHREAVKQMQANPQLFKR